MILRFVNWIACRDLSFFPPRRITLNIIQLVTALLQNFPSEPNIQLQLLLSSVNISYNAYFSFVSLNTLLNLKKKFTNFSHIVADFVTKIHFPLRNFAIKK